MFGRIILGFCIQAVILQSVWSQCTNRVGVPTSPGLAIPYGAGLTASSFASPAYIAPVGVNPCANSALSAPAIEVAPTSGGSLPVTSASAVPPDNIVLTSENVYEGTLNVAGELPFVGTVGLDGVIPSAGTGAVSHSCGGPARIRSANLGPAVANSAITPNVYGSSLGLAGLAGITGTEVGQIGGFPGVGYSGIGCAGIPSSYPGSGYSGIGCAGIPSSYPGSGLSVGVPYTGLVETGSVREAIGTGILPGDVGYYDGLGSGVVVGLGGYGGDGEGNIAVIGDLPTAGETVVVGQVPIEGIVGFRGPVPAYGTVSISGFCSCGCDIPYL